MMGGNVLSSALSRVSLMGSSAPSSTEQYDALPSASASLTCTPSSAPFTSSLNSFFASTASRPLPGLIHGMCSAKLTRPSARKASLSPASSSRKRTAGSQTANLGSTTSRCTTFKNSKPVRPLTIHLRLASSTPNCFPGLSDHSTVSETASPEMDGTTTCSLGRSTGLPWMLARFRRPRTETESVQTRPDGVVDLTGTSLAYLFFTSSKPRRRSPTC
mmetsp:Transcript_299/g.888  ORF Transcript_299/g.888 Transcript_299/m.888 type:complete len:217 (+) Transcript_299:516-1166(+)